PLHTGYAIRKPLTGSARPAAPLPHAPSPRACSRSSEPAGRHARSRALPGAAAPPPPVRCERSMLASPIPQTWYAYLITLPHLGIPGSRYYFSTPKAGGPVDKQQPTQGGRALAELSIEHIPAYS